MLVVGVGSRLRGDDSAGPYTIDLIKKRMEKGEHPEEVQLELIDADVMPENFTKPIRESGADAVYFVDAVDMGLGTGELRRVPDDLIDETIPCSHNLPMSYVMAYVREKVRTVELIGVQVKVTGLFEEMNDHVSGSCGKLADMIMAGRAGDIPLYSRDEKRSEDDTVNYCW
ncbi:MAG: hydrogenase maturation protease [Thermoplasmatota archaeon]